MLGEDKLDLEMSPIFTQYILGTLVAAAFTAINWGISIILARSTLKRNLAQIGYSYDWIDGRIDPGLNRNWKASSLAATSQLFIHGIGSWLSVSIMSYQFIVQLWHWLFCPSEVRQARTRLLNERLSKEDVLKALCKIHDYQDLGSSIQSLKDEIPMKTSNNWFLFLKKKKKLNSDDDVEVEERTSSRNF